MRIEVTNKQFGIGFVFLVMTNTRAICRAYTQGVMVLCEGGRSARSNVSREDREVGRAAMTPAYCCCAARRPNLTTPMFTAPPSQRSPQGAGGGVNRKAIYYHDWNAERRLNEEVRHLRSLS